MKKIMVVDDSRFMHDEITYLLENTGFQVVACCRDAEQAFTSYHKHCPDAVLMDVVLPGIDGLEATKALLAKWPQAVVIIISSLAYDETITLAKESGAKCFLFKPFTRQELVQVLEQSLAGTSC